MPEQEGLPGGGAVLPSAGAGAGLGCAAGGGGRRARGPLLRPGPGQVRRPAHSAGAGVERGAPPGGRGAVLVHRDPGHGVQRPVRRGRCRGLLRREAEHRHPGPPPPLHPGDPGVPRRAGEHPGGRQAPRGYRLPPPDPDLPPAGAGGPGLRYPLRPQADRAGGSGGACDRPGGGGARRALPPPRPAGGPGPGQQRPGHLPDAPRRRGAHGAQAPGGRGPHRAPPAGHRPDPVQGAGRPPPAGGRQLQAQLPPGQRPGGVQLLRLPRGAGGGRRQRGGADRHQRHEPLRPGRGELQRRAAGQRHPGGLPRPGPPGGDRLPAGAGGAGLCRRGRRLYRPRPAGGGLPGPTALDRTGQGPAHLPSRRPLVQPVAGAAGRYLPVSGGGPAPAG